MRRTSFIPHDQDREDQRAEERDEQRQMFDCPIEYTEPDERFGTLDPTDPEFGSVDAFAEYLFDDDREQYDHFELNCLNACTGLRVQVIRERLAKYGLTLKRRPVERSFRGFSDNPHNRWAGNPMAGGGGGASIYGMAD